MRKDTTLTKLFVGGLPYHTGDETLRQFFEKFGDIQEAVVMTDKLTGKSHGYGFVTMIEPGAAALACKDAYPFIDGRKANVSLAYLGAKKRRTFNDLLATIQSNSNVTEENVYPEQQTGVSPTPSETNAETGHCYASSEWSSPASTDCTTQSASASPTFPYYNYPPPHAGTTSPKMHETQQKTIPYTPVAPSCYFPIPITYPTAPNVTQSSAVAQTLPLFYTMPLINTTSSIPIYPTARNFNLINSDDIAAGQHLGDSFCQANCQYTYLGTLNAVGNQMYPYVEYRYV